jgi:two-component system, OmpR family, response regulator ChvI
MNSSPSIALVLQDRNIVASLKLAFEADGFDVHTYGDGMEALDALSDAPTDIAILGRRLPRLPGPDLFRQLRHFTAMPVMFLSSMGSELAEQAPDADEYLEMPFSVRLVVERAKAVLKRHQMARRAATPPPVISSGGLMIERPRRRCHWRQERVYLNMPEFLILEALADSGVQTRFALMIAAYGDQVEMDEEVVDEHISGLVGKFRLVDPTFDLIELVGGVAYRLKRSA